MDISNICLNDSQVSAHTDWIVAKVKQHQRLEAEGGLNPQEPR